ncbi:hypothetical protein L1049_013417 [Liquidambar formosana]|uniref:Embryo defective 1703 n=1 Tax=Liquidambar formosana TaxID=63359 RepID=A0AAP0RL46_LIQFO
MEVLNTPISNSSHIFSRVSPLLSPKFSIQIRNKKNPPRLYVPNSKFSLYSPFSTRFPFSKTKNLQISAQFGRSSNRRNSLRKKLIDDQQVRRNPLYLDPSRSFDVNEKETESNYRVGDDVVESGSVGESGPKSERLGDSALLNKLENWVDQYKKDVEFWGIGSGPIFTVYKGSDGNVERVVVNEDEILRRSGRQEFEDFTEVSLKISHAKHLASEMENGKYVIPKNSSVAKFVVSGEHSGFGNVIRGVTLQPHLFSKLSRVGIALLFGFFVFWAVKTLFSVKNHEVELTRLEKEMLRRKIKSRMEREKLEKGSVEVIPDSSESPMVFTERPKLDKQELMDRIVKVKASNYKLALQDSSSFQINKPMDFDDRIQEIREMARHAREIEGESSSLDDGDLDDGDGEKIQAANEELSNEMEVINQHGEGCTSSLSNPSNGYSGGSVGTNEIIESVSLGITKSDDTRYVKEVTFVENVDMQAPSTSSLEDLNDRESMSHYLKDGESILDLSDAKEMTQYADPSHSESFLLEKSSSKTNPRVIRSVKEAREYLSRKRDKQEPNQDHQVRIMQEGAVVLTPPTDSCLRSNKSQRLFKDDKVFEPSILGGTPTSTPARNDFEDSAVKNKGFLPTKIGDHEDAEDKYGGGDIRNPIASQDYEGNGSSRVTGVSADKGNWMEKNFHEFEPVVKKIGAGFRDNYMVSREKANQELSINSEMTQLGRNEDDSELEWMKDDALREIVFQVRENELAGRDPFYMMDAEDKVAFFKGLERKVEKENEKLLNVHEWLHSNIENLDYGTDGISLYDPVEKIIPRWKGPPVDRNPEFLDNFVEQRKAFVAGNAEIPYPVKKGKQEFLQKSEESSSHENIPTSSTAYELMKKSHGGASLKSKTVIEGSDSSVRAGKKSGKEYWQHTKKWSRGFLESYNAETDPEIKSIMKDMGKDLDRWITEKEVQEAADLMTKLPERNKKFIEKKLEKLKREMELFGPQAVVSKYSEYAEAKDEDYLWWLDLPFVLCIELYTNENGEQRIGFYSLEMAADLNLDPKQHHVIGFEDPGDCKNLCYIIQAHMDMLGNGLAFVVARPPKDAFREAKENGFSVTVIRKGELKLNVDQTLEEVEEQITEIGSKIYHDKIMRECSVDISSLMKGVFGASKPTKRKRSKRMLKKPHEQ